MLGTTGVRTGTATTAVMMKGIFPYDWTWPQSFLFGAFAAATAPVAASCVAAQRSEQVQKAL